MNIRPATPDDAAAIAAVHVLAWRESYPGLVPDSVLAALDPARRTEIWHAAIPRGGVFVAEDDADLVGFVAWGPQSDTALPFAAEIHALYVLRRAQWRGLGRALMGAAAADMRQAGFHSLGLWVLDGSAPARRFYETLGGRLCATRQDTREGWTAHETAYGWDDLGPLCPPCVPDSQA
jgi:GNAT superfamily N-acetyltransferase